MIVELCDLCKKNKVNESNKTEVIIKDCKGVEISAYGFPMPAKRKFKAVICDDCLNKLRGIEPPTGGSAIEPHPPKRK